MNQNTDVRMTKLDYASFVSDLGRFCTRSDELYDGWQLISQPEVHAVKQTILNGCLRAEYHIIYSHSYQVPVMYFRVHDLKGKLDYFWPHHNQITEIANAVHLFILVCLL